MSPSNGNGELILLVDSDKSVLDMASIIFELRGYRVISAGNSMQAFELYEKQSSRIAAILLDVGMPIMDGLELSRILTEINPDVKIIAGVKPDAPQNELELRELGVRHFLPKPYNVPQLLKTVHKAIHPKAAVK